MCAPDDIQHGLVLMKCKLLEADPPTSLDHTSSDFVAITQYRCQFSADRGTGTKTNQCEHKEK